LMTKGRNFKAGSRQQKTGWPVSALWKPYVR